MKTSVGARALLTGSITTLFLMTGGVSAEKVREKIPSNPREWVEPYQTMYQFMWVKYLMFIPKDYAKSDKKFPLILYFHGAGQKGDNPNELSMVALNAQRAGRKRDSFPFIVVSPQLPGPSGFTLPYSLDRGTWYYDEFFVVVDKLLDHVI